MCVYIYNPQSPLAAPGGRRKITFLRVRVAQAVNIYIYTYICMCMYIIYIYIYLYIYIYTSGSPGREKSSNVFESARGSSSASTRTR